MHGRAGSAPGPLPPPPLAELLGGGVGGGLAGRVLPGDSERGRGVLWQAKAESWSGGFFQRVIVPHKSGKFSRRILLAGFSADYFSAFIWRVFIASKSSGFLKKAKQNKEKQNDVYPIDL